MSSDEWIEIRHEEESLRGCSLRHARCAWLFCLGAAAGEGPTDSMANWLNPLLQRSPNRGFSAGAAELGYVEGKNIIIEWRGADGNRDRQSVLVAELVRLKVDVIVTSGGGPTRGAKEATATIPIVFAQDTDPIGNGFVASLARPGGNITGLSRLAPELTGKQIELLKEVVPKVLRVAVFANLTSPSYSQVLKETKLAAGALAVKLQYVDVQGPKDFETAFRQASKERANAVLWVVSGNVASPHRKTIAELAIILVSRRYTSRQHLSKPVA